MNTISSILSSITAEEIKLTSIEEMRKGKAVFEDGGALLLVIKRAQIDFERLTLNWPDLEEEFKIEFPVEKIVGRGLIREIKPALAKALNTDREMRARNQPGKLVITFLPYTE